MKASTLALCGAVLVAIQVVAPASAVLTPEQCFEELRKVESADFAKRTLACHDSGETDTECCKQLDSLFGYYGTLDGCLCGEDFHSVMLESMPIDRGVTAENFVEDLKACNIPAKGLGCGGSEAGPLVKAQGPIRRIAHMFISKSLGYKAGYAAGAASTGYGYPYGYPYPYGYGGGYYDDDDDDGSGARPVAIPPYNPPPMSPPRPQPRSPRSKPPKIPPRPSSSPSPASGGGLFQSSSGSPPASPPAPAPAPPASPASPASPPSPTPAPPAPAAPPAPMPSSAPAPASSHGSGCQSMATGGGAVDLSGAGGCVIVQG